MLSRDACRRKPNPKLRDDEQEPDMRCGAPGTSWHVTAKSSICVGVRFINPASTQGKLCALPREICTVSGESGLREEVTLSDRCAEVSRGHSRGASSEGPNGAPVRSG